MVKWCIEYRTPLTKVWMRKKEKLSSSLLVGVGLENFPFPSSYIQPTDMISCSDRVQFYIMVEVVESHEHALILLFKVMVEVVESQHNLTMHSHLYIPVHNLTMHLQCTYWCTCNLTMHSQCTYRCTA